MIVFEQNWKEKAKGPLYRALAGLLRDKILSGALKGGTKIPPSRKLAETLEVSRNTVTQALDILHGDGFLLGRTGDGVYVANGLEKVNSFPSSKKREGVSLRTLPKRSLELARTYADKKAHGNIQAFSPGRPALEEFPFDIWARLLSRRWRLDGVKLAMAEDPMGYRPLRELISNHLRETRGVLSNADQIIIVSGAQQGLDLIARVLWETGDQIAIEDPAFPGLNGVIEAAGCTSVAIELDQEGMAIELLPSNLNSILVTPSRNYPIGTSMSLERRLGLLAYARKNESWIIEDDFDCDFRFDGPPLSSMQGLDQEGRVIYVGTFSRVMFPALRIGFVVCPTALVPYFCAAKAFMDGHGAIIPQIALYDFMNEGYFASHLRKMKKLYQQRRDYLYKCLDQDFRDWGAVQLADGGLHLSFVFHDNLNDVKIVEELKGQGILARPLRRFYRGKTYKQGLVMGFAGYKETEMALGLAKLRKILLDEKNTFNP